MEQGADPDLRSQDGNTALMIAADKGVLNTVTELMRHGADINVRNKAGKTALMIAAGPSSQFRVAKVLLDSGASVSVTDETGETALTLAEANDNPAIVRAIQASQQNCPDLLQNTTTGVSNHHPLERLESFES